MLLHEIVRAEARDAGQAVGEVEVAAGLVVRPLLGGDDLAQERAQLRVVERALALDRIEMPFTRMRGGVPAARCRSEPERSFSAISNASIAAMDPPPAQAAAALASSTWRAASSALTTPFCTSSRIELSSSAMPWREPVCRIEWIWNVLFSRIRLRPRA